MLQELNITFEPARHTAVLDREERISHLLNSARKLLPEQGPIGVFVHHNTLHHFENMRFETAVEKMSATLGAEPYMSHSAYINSVITGRITQHSLNVVITRNVSEGMLSKNIPLWAGTSLNTFYRKLLLTPAFNETGNTIEHILSEKNTLTHFARQTSAHAKERLRRQAETQLHHESPEHIWSQQAIDQYALTSLWKWLSAHVTHRMPPLTDASYMRDISPASFNTHADQRVNERLITFLSNCTDQGIAYWKIPFQNRNLLGTFIYFIAQGEKGLPHCLRWVNPNDLASIQEFTSTRALLTLLDTLGIKDSEHEAFIQAELLKLPGWAGTVALFEANPALVSDHPMRYALSDFLVIRLLLLHHALDGEHLTQKRHAAPPHRTLLCTRLSCFYLFQALGIGVQDLNDITPNELKKTLALMFNIDEIKRRRLLHHAYEHSYKTTIMNAVLLNKKRQLHFQDTPQYQALFCIDDREESLRRHLEETEPHCETWGVAGFFGLDMRYKGVNDPHAVPLCPAAIHPKYVVEEIPIQPHRHAFMIASNRHTLVQKTLRHIYDHSRDFATGTLFTVLGGILSCFPLFFRIHFPRICGKFLTVLHHHFFPSVESELCIERPESAPQHKGLLKGFSTEEMAERVYGILKNAGMSQFSPLVFIIGHGSSSLNNPHESAHDCGACGGRRGGPNARAFAQMANTPAVRKHINQLGLRIPPETHFIGGYHDTCSDEITYFDTHRVPSALSSLLKKARSDFDRARQFDAHERCRRFEDAKDFNPTLALKHVQGRSQNLREPRPEYGHCTNAMCIIGRRALTRNLFLDRRAFLVSYDASTDHDGSQLSALLSGVIPVCAGINLEYYFSFVDNEKYGCGTKLPHNVTGLIGVMNGSRSDLRTGLPWQMVEIHEPVRLVTIIEARQSIMDHILGTVPLVKKLVENRWIQLGLINPITEEITWYEGLKRIAHDTEPTPLKEYSTSESYYSGKMVHLPPVFITERAITQRGVK